VRTPKSTRLPRDERREQLVRLGVELLGSRPHEQVSIGDIARAAGISKGLLYHYFPTKSDFVVAVLRQSRDELEARMRAGAAEARNPSEALDRSLDAFLAYAEEHATGFQAVVRARGGEDEPVRAELDEARRLRVDAMVTFAAALAGRPADEVRSPALETAIEGWLSFCDGAVGRWLARRDLEREAVGRLLRATLLAALEAVADVDPQPPSARVAAGARRIAERPGTRKTQVFSAT
jgi:AcrR family transcriptional regulator